MKEGPEFSKSWI